MSVKESDMSGDDSKISSDDKSPTSKNLKDKMKIKVRSVQIFKLSN